MKQYNVVWDSPSADCTGVMPIGNGDIGAGVYAVENGALVLLLSKNDAFNYAGDIYKTGRVAVTISPNPFGSENFTQTLDIETGCIRIETQSVSIKIWVDANDNVYHIELNAPADFKVTVTPEFWERPDGTKDVCRESGEQLIWYFHVGDKSTYRDELKPHLVEYMADTHPDPYRYNTFGNLLECGGMTREGGTLHGAGKSFDIRIYSLCKQTPDIDEWIDEIGELAKDYNTRENTWQSHLSWWSQFWQRSHITISDNEIPPQQKVQPNFTKNADGVLEAADNGALVAQGYNVFRFLMACQSRGRNQTKFNGGLFTQQFFTVDMPDKRNAPYIQPDGRLLLHEDDRLWGSRYTFQNQRLMYWPMLMGGDFDLMSPFFNYYFKLLDHRRAVCKAWFGHTGAYFRENVQPTGMDIDEGGGLSLHPAKTKRGEEYEGWYHDYYFTCSLELVTMMIEYVQYTGDAVFKDGVLLPTAREVLKFYDNHYERDEKGRFVMDPAQVLETFWIAVNPAPDIAGLHYNLKELLGMNAGNSEDTENWKRLLSELPEIPLQTKDGKTVIAPAEKYSKKENFENGELYPVFPFNHFGVGYGTGDIVKNTMAHRTNPDSMDCGCWSQDQIDWAYAGDALAARDGLIKRFKIASPHHRFPFYGRENPDSCPDFDHFGSGSVALQRMLVQQTADKIVLLPAWPRNWDVTFKLKLRQGGTIEGEVKNGELIHWDISPKELSKQVIIKDTQ